MNAKIIGERKRPSVNLSAVKRGQAVWCKGYGLCIAGVNDYGNFCLTNLIDGSCHEQPGDTQVEEMQVELFHEPI